MSKAIFMPGASLMKVTPVDGGLEIRCPGCRAVQIIADGTVGDVGFRHADNGCPVLRRIEAAMREYERTTVRRG